MVKKPLSALMKLFVVFFFLLPTISIFSDAQTISSAYESSHAIEVARLTNWAPEYLTVTNSWNGMCINPSTSSLRCMSVITAINGQSVADMDCEEFYEILDSSDSFELTYLTKTEGRNKEYKKQFTKRRGKLLITPTAPNRTPTTVSLLSDSDVDFFKYNTFDYRLAGDDQLMDKTIMEVFADQLRQKGLKRVQESPDIYLYVTKDVNQKIESMYVPQYTTTTNSNASSVGVSNFLGIRGVNVGGVAGSSTTVTQETGSMRTNVTADAYLEFSILDANKLDQSEAPVVWQLTYSQHLNSEIRLLEDVKNWIGNSMIQYPFHESVIGTSAYTWGVFCENFASKPIISDIVPTSKAAQLGCKVGDEIKYVRYRGTDADYCIFRPKQPFYEKEIIPTSELMQVGKLKTPKGGIKERVVYTFIKQ